MTNPIIVALDVASAQEAMSLVRRLGDSVAMYKVGLELRGDIFPQRKIAAKRVNEDERLIGARPGIHVALRERWKPTGNVRQNTHSVENSERCRRARRAAITFRTRSNSA